MVVAALEIEEITMPEMQDTEALTDLEVEVLLLEACRARDFKAIKFYLQRMDARKGRKVVGSDFTEIRIYKDNA